MVLKEDAESSDYESDFNSDNESKCEQSQAKFKFLKKGQGKLASHNHGITKFAKQRKEKIIREQEQRELDYDEDD